MTQVAAVKRDQLRGIFNVDSLSDGDFKVTITPISDAEAVEIEFKSLKGIAGKPLDIDEIRRERLKYEGSLDTNTVLDYLGANQGFTENADRVFELAAKRKDIKLVSSSAITDILYVLRRAVKDRELVKRKYESFRKKISILSVTEADIDKAFARDWKDFEDAVQYTVAESNAVDCIITRNKNDFEENRIPIYTPQEFIEQFAIK